MQFLPWPQLATPLAEFINHARGQSIYKKAETERSFYYREFNRDFVY